MINLNELNRDELKEESSLAESDPYDPEHP